MSAAQDAVRARARTASAGVRSAKSWATFLERVNLAGGTVLEPAWLGSDAPHRVRCGQGHEVAPRPCNVRPGSAVCRVCAGQSPEASWQVFQVLVTQFGGLVLEPTWLGSGMQHRIQCSQGHLVSVRPSSVQQGQGICRACKGKKWDVFYVVSGAYVVKFGVTSGNPAKRLSDHASKGLRTVHRVAVELPEGRAVWYENQLMAGLTNLGVNPAQGREYFHLSELELVLSFVDHNLGVVSCA